MQPKYSFIPISLILLCGLAWWSVQVGSFDISEHFHGSHAKPSPSRTAIRREVIEVLDRAIAYQHYFHSVYGRFSDSLKRAGFHIPIGVEENYDIRVVESTADRVLIHAYGRAEKKMDDVISVDQDFHLEANFQTPAPRADYLKKHALRHLHQLKDTPKGRIVADEGIYNNYFKYLIEDSQEKGKTIGAVGVQPPVSGFRIEISEIGRPGADTAILENMLLADWSDEPRGEMIESKQTGQLHIEDMNQLQDEAQLAQTIFRGEVGRYAKNWAELSRIAHFPYKGEHPESADWEWENVMQGVIPSDEPKRDVSSTTDPAQRKQIRQRLQFEPIRQ